MAGTTRRLGSWASWGCAQARWTDRRCHWMTSGYGRLAGNTEKSKWTYMRNEEADGALEAVRQRL